jgi:hypothetical protein
MRAILVSHTHWDREWYRTFQAFRARLVDTVDLVLDHCARDPGYCFLLDGQSIALLDYAEIRPGRVPELRARIAEGRVAIGPWFVQPDSLLPSGEAHVRNLLLGRSAGEAFGPVSRAGYTPDSFGHPAQFPQLFAGFGIDSFVYWRGHGDEIDRLPAEYDWVAPDGSAVLACHLGKGYFAAASDPRLPLAPAVERIAQAAKELAARTRSGALLLMNGIDHAPPDGRSAELAEGLARATGFAVERGLLEEFVAHVASAPGERPRYAGELAGARISPLLPGVWSTRTWIKLANRACEAELEGWAEPFAALARRAGAPDERPALALAWRTLLQNHAHDSICGCSRDEVHEQMRPRFTAARELAEETASRALARLAGQAPDRRLPWSDELDVAVWNPSPHPRTDVARFAFDPHPFAFPASDPRDALHPTLLHDLAGASYEVDGAPARLVAVEEPGRVKLLPGRAAYDVEFVARDVPAFGWKRFALRRTTRALADEDRAVVAGSADAAIASGALRVAVAADGTVDLAIGARCWRGLFGVEDVGDRGDSYDFDGVGTNAAELVSVSVERVQHAAGIHLLRVGRTFRVPACLDGDRETRDAGTVELELWMELRLADGVPRLDARVRCTNAARDHRLRLLFPLGERVARFDAATTFDVCDRTPGARPDAGWVQRAPDTFPCQGFVHASGLTIAAPGLAEASVFEGGGESVVAFTLLRCVGHLSRHDLRTRPGPAGPGTDTPGAQCPGDVEAHLSLFAGLDPRGARDAELGLRAVAAGEAPLAAEGAPLVTLAPRALVLSALKPAERGEGLILRVLNPTAEAHQAELRLGLPFTSARFVRLDESDADGEPAREGATLRFEVPVRRIVTLRIA